MYEGYINTPFRLGTWLVEPNLNRLSDGDRVLALEPRLMDVLTYLASRHGKTVTADELLETVWHGRVQGDNTIYQAIAHLRKLLGDDAYHPHFIETIAKKGYRLICPVMSDAEDAEPAIIAIQPSSGWRNSRRVIAVLTGIVSIAVVIILAANPHFRDQLLQTNDGPIARSVAVLPFVDMSEDGSQRYLGDGVSDELIHALSNLPDLRVTARTSSFAFRDGNDDIRQIGSKLNVAAILEGSVRKDGDRIRVTAQLVDSRDGYHLWSLTFDRSFADIFSIQSEIAVAVAKTFEYRELNAFLIDDHAMRPKESQAYEFYLLGKHNLDKETPSNYMRAIQHFEAAIEMDPNFARAYAGLALSWLVRYWVENEQEWLIKAESAADYALFLDDQAAEAYVALGRVKFTKRDLAGAEAAYGKAVDLNPNDARAYGYLAYTYRLLEREDEADVMLQKALERHPMSGELNTLRGHLYNTSVAHRNLDMALKYFKRAMEVEPDYPGSYELVGLLYASIGQLDQAIPYLRKNVDMSAGPTQAGRLAGLLARIYVNIGDYESAAQVIRRARELEPNHFGATQSEIHLRLARGDFSAARDIVHGLRPKYVDNYYVTSLMASYEMVIGDLDHAREIYTFLTAAPEPSGINDDVSLYEPGLGKHAAVNLAYLHKINGDDRAAREWLVKAREYIESMSDRTRMEPGSHYVLARIAAVEGNYDAAIEYVREAVEAGWSKTWFGRIDPIMAELRKDARYIHVLEELEDKLLEMREHPKVLASNEP